LIIKHELSMPNFCPTCGKALQYENAEICPGCGVRIQPPQVPKEIRSPFWAILFSFFLAGWGQWYNGKTGDGLKFFGAFIATYILALIFLAMVPTLPAAAIPGLLLIVVVLAIWVYGMYDSYKGAERINKGEENFSGKSGLFWLPVALLVLVIFFIVAAVIAAFVFGMAGSTPKLP